MTASFHILYNSFFANYSSIQCYTTVAIQNTVEWSFMHNTNGLTQAKGLIPGPSARRVKDLLKLNRDQLRWMVGLFIGHSPKRAPFQTGIDWWPNLWKVPRRRRISHIYPMWLWGHSLFKISSPGPVYHGTKWTTMMLPQTTSHTSFEV
jgi:hypothetical protein